ncbi:hypothetical protein IHN63_00465 [Deinococcus sp. 6YEL10]|uniref:hypothetical protein n=1 Tax=Deinococcus sp. 6YEL10 TaxID=2745870 RepID=UPI001E5065FB|nr:hypothetical protein [Deinococcus sp. 6YEL10]MCD0159772.1 hypothetical protein [Deinococcus sp. 6YEL10]
MSAFDIPFNIKVGVSGTNLNNLVGQFQTLDRHAASLHRSLTAINNLGSGKSFTGLRGMASDLSKAAAAADVMDRRVRSLTAGLMTFTGAANTANAAARNLRFDPAMARIIDQTAAALGRMNATAANPRDLAAMGRGLGGLMRATKKITAADITSLTSLSAALNGLSNFKAPDMSKFNTVTRALRSLGNLPQLDAGKINNVATAVGGVQRISAGLAAANAHTIDPARFQAITLALRAARSIQNVKLDATKLAALSQGVNRLTSVARNLAAISATAVNPANIAQLVTAVNALRGLKFTTAALNAANRAGQGIGAIGKALRGFPVVNPATMTAISDVFRILSTLRVPRNVGDLGPALVRIRSFMVGLNTIPVDPTKIGALTAVMTAIGRIRMNARTSTNLGTFFTSFNTFVTQMASKLPILSQLERTLAALSRVRSPRLGGAGGGSLGSGLRRANTDARLLHRNFDALRGSLARLSLDRFLYDMHKLKRTMTDLRFFLLGGGLGVGVTQFAKDVLKANGEIQQLQMTLQYTMTRPGQSLAEGYMGARDAMSMFRDEANKTGQPLMEMYRAGTGMAAVLKAFGMNNKQNLIDAMGVAQRLAAFDPAQGLSGANIAMREALAGDWRSLRLRFEIPGALINELKDQGLGAIQVIDQALNRMGITRDLVVKSAATFTGQVQRIKNNFFDFWMQSSNEVTGNLANTLNGVATQLEKFMSSAGGGSFKQAFSDAFVALGSVVSRFLINTVTGGAKAFTSLSAAWKNDTMGIASVFRTVGGVISSAVSGVRMGFAAFSKTVSVDRPFEPLVYFGRIATLYLPRAIEKVGKTLGEVFRAIRPGLDSLQIAFVRVFQAIGMGMGELFRKDRAMGFADIFNNIALTIRRAAEALTMDNLGAELVRGFLAVSATLRLMNTTIGTVFSGIKAILGVASGLVKTGPLSLLGRAAGASRLPAGAVGAPAGEGLLGRVIGGARGIANAGLLRSNSFLVGLLPMLAGPLAGLSRLILGPVIGGGLTFLTAAAMPAIVASFIGALSPVAGNFIQGIISKIPLIGPTLGKVLGGMTTFLGSALKNVINSIFGPDTFARIRTGLNGIVTNFVDMIAYAFGRTTSPITGKDIGVSGVNDPAAVKRAAQDTLRLDQAAVRDVMGGFRVSTGDLSAVRKLTGLSNYSDDQLARLLEQVFRVTDGGTTDNTAELWAAIKSGKMGGFTPLLKNYTNGDLGALVNASRGDWASRGGFTTQLKHDTLTSILTGKTPEALLYNGKTYNPALFGQRIVKMSETDAQTYNLLQQKIKSVGLTAEETARYRNLQRQIGDTNGRSTMVAASKYTGAKGTIPYGSVEEVLAYQGIVGAKNYVQQRGGVPQNLSASAPSSVMFGYLKDLIALNGGDASKVDFKTVQASYGELYKALVAGNKTPGALDPAATQMAVMLQVLRQSGVNLDAIRRSSEDIKANTKPGTDTSMFDSKRYAALQVNLTERKGWEETWSRRSKLQVPDIFSVGTLTGSKRKEDFELGSGGTFVRNVGANYASQYVQPAQLTAFEGLGINTDLIKGIAKGLADALGEVKGKLGLEEFVGNLVEGAKSVKEFGTAVKTVSEFLASFSHAQKLGYKPWDALNIAQRGGDNMADLNMFLAASGKGGQKVSLTAANRASDIISDLAVMNPTMAKHLRNQLRKDPSLAAAFASKMGNSPVAVAATDIGFGQLISPTDGARHRADFAKSYRASLKLVGLEGMGLDWLGQYTLSQDEITRRHIYDGIQTGALPDTRTPTPATPHSGGGGATFTSNGKTILPPKGKLWGQGRIPGLPTPTADGSFGGALITQAYKSLTDATTDITGQCSAWVRQVVEKTLGKAAGSLQNSALFGGSAIETMARQQSAGLVKDFKAAGGQAALKNGDLLFNGNHVGIYMNGMVLENTTRRSGGVSGQKGARGWVTVGAFNAKQVSRLTGWDGKNDWSTALGGKYMGGALPGGSPYKGSGVVQTKGKTLLPPLANTGNGIVNQEFLNEVIKIGVSTGVNPATLMAIMDFETGGKFRADTPNANKTAFGLLQFNNTALRDINENFGTKFTLDSIQKMSPVTQLKEVVQRYMMLQKDRGLLKNGGSFADLYMSVLFPWAANKPDDTILFGKGAAYKPHIYGYGKEPWIQNGGMINGKVADESITKGEMAAKAASRTNWLMWSANAADIRNLGVNTPQGVSSAGSLWQSGAISYDAALPSAQAGTIVTGDDVKVSFSFGDIKLSGAATEADAKKFAQMVAVALDNPAVVKKLMDAYNKARRNRGG